MDNVKTAPGNGCKLYKKCGGCQLQNLTYEEQLKYKQRLCQKLLSKFCKVSPIIGMEKPLHYRNKVQAAFGTTRDGRIVSGVYQSGTHRIVPVDLCMTEDKKADEIIVSIRSLMKNFRMTAYNEDSEKGFLRHVLVKRGFSTNQVMVVMVTATPVFPAKNNFVRALRKLHPEITTIVQNINQKHTNLILGERQNVLFGTGYIEDILLGLKFRISPSSFYQINPVQTRVLYEKAIEYAQLKKGERILDAYCGIGTIGMCAASRSEGEVIGVELNRNAVRDAIFNAKRNDMKNIRFFCDDAGKFMVDTAKAGEKFDVVFMDPPRAGSSEEFLSSLITLSPKRVVYISCNPETMARDLEFLTANSDYRVKKLTPVDMFPHTNHVETVALLSRQINVHKMKLNSTPFEMIKSGEKTIELRLFDEKRQQVKTGDKIVFTNNANGETLNTTVVKLHRFDSFEELYKSLPLLKCGYTTKDVEKATPSDMEHYYSVEEQRKYGVVGIELCRPE